MTMVLKEDGARPGSPAIHAVAAQGRLPGLHQACLPRHVSVRNPGLGRNGAAPNQPDAFLDVKLRAFPSLTRAMILRCHKRIFGQCKMGKGWPRSVVIFSSFPFWWVARWQTILSHHQPGEQSDAAQDGTECCQHGVPAHQGLRCVPCSMCPLQFKSSDQSLSR